MITDPDNALDMGGLDGMVGYLLRRAQIAVFQNFTRTMAELDIRPAQFSVLLLIASNPGVSQAQISDQLGIKRANFVVMLDALEARGLARRQRSSIDRRSHAVSLTPDGEAIMKRLVELEAVHERRITDRIGHDGKRQLLAMLSEIAALND